MTSRGGTYADETFLEGDVRDGDDERGYDPHGETGGEEGGGVTRFSDERLITLVIVVGAALFLFPEPATSGLGVLLLAIGVVAWLVDWAT